MKILLKKKEIDHTIDEIINKIKNLKDRQDELIKIKIMDNIKKDFNLMSKEIKEAKKDILIEQKKTIELLEKKYNELMAKFIESQKEIINLNRTINSLNDYIKENNINKKENKIRNNNNDLFQPMINYNENNINIKDNNNSFVNKKNIILKNKYNLPLLHFTSENKNDFLNNKKNLISPPSSCKRNIKTKRNYFLKFKKNINTTFIQPKSNNTSREKSNITNIIPYIVNIKFQSPNISKKKK